MLSHPAHLNCRYSKLHFILESKEQRRITETRQQLAEIKDALLGFAIIHGRLPCPALPQQVAMEKKAPLGAAIAAILITVLCQPQH
jgi:hypothetical protein